MDIKDSTMKPQKSVRILQKIATEDGRLRP
jgi:hypothetical protein